MIGLLTAIHVLVALVLILVILLQSAKGGDLAGAFGGMGSQTAFGPRGTSNFLSKTTAILAAVFMVTSVTLAIISNRGHRGGSVLSNEPVKTAPATPALPPGLTGQPPQGTNAGTPAPAQTIPVPVNPAPATPSPSK